MPAPTAGRSSLTFSATVLLALILAVAAGAESHAQPVPVPETGAASDGPQQQVPVVQTVDDRILAGRLQEILEATGWYVRPTVAVRDGVVFLGGSAETQDQIRWAGALAEKIEGAVAVVNRMELAADVGSTFGRAGTEVSAFLRRAIQAWPLVVTGVLILVIATLLARLATAVARRLFSARIPSPLLLAVVVRLFSIPIFLLGVYFVLQIAGLTRLAVTVLGGTGLFGIIIGFAFRDIAENFLASLLLSVRNPFRTGDLIEVAGQTGVVENLNTRSTVLLTLDGNHVQIPNATVFKSTIKNYSTSPSRRADFMVGIGYDSPVAKAQLLISEILAEHPAVLSAPEPLVLVDALGDATVNLKVLYWFDSATYAPDKINSALLRLTKNRLLEGGIELPDPAREIIFPRGVPLVRAEPADRTPAPMHLDKASGGDERVATAGEGGLANVLPRVGASGCAAPEADENLLKT